MAIYTDLARTMNDFQRKGAADDATDLHSEATVLTVELFWANRPAMRVVQALHWLHAALADPDDRRRVLRRLRAILANLNQGPVIAADLIDGLLILPT